MIVEGANSIKVDSTCFKSLQSKNIDTTIILGSGQLPMNWHFWCCINDQQNDDWSQAMPLKFVESEKSRTVRYITAESKTDTFLVPVTTEEKAFVDHLASLMDTTRHKHQVKLLHKVMADICQGMCTFGVVYIQKLIFLFYRWS